ncbi:oligosaccharide flippase family protein, partial [Myroides odoratimimus]
IFAQLSGLVAGIALAILGYGVYALVYSTLINTVVGTLLVVLEGLKFHKPALYFSYQNVKTYMSFGLYQLGEKLMNYLNSDVDTLIIGKFVGVESLGVYSLAKNFISKPYQVINPILTKIGFPLMAKVQNDNHILQRFYKGIVTILSYINFPLHLFVFAFPELVVNIIFGDKWDQAIIPLKILALCYLLRSTMNPIGSLQLAKGKANYGFYWNLVQFLALPLVMYLSSFWGIIGICIGITLFQFVMFSVIGKVMVEKLCGLRIKEYYAIFIKPFVYCFISYLVTKLSLQIIEFDSIIIDFLYTGIVFISFYGIIV